MKKIPSLLFTIILSLGVTTRALAVGGQSHGGGVSCEQEFLMLALATLSDVGSFDLEKELPIPLAELKEKVKTVEVKCGKEALTVEGIPVTARFNRNANLIEVNELEFKDASSTLRKSINLHEYFGVLGLEESRRYTFSAPLVLSIEERSKSGATIIAEPGTPLFAYEAAVTELKAESDTKKKVELAIKILRQYFGFDEVIVDRRVDWRYVVGTAESLRTSLPFFTWSRSFLSIHCGFINAQVKDNRAAPATNSGPIMKVDDEIIQTTEIRRLRFVVNDTLTGKMDTQWKSDKNIEEITLGQGKKEALKWLIASSLGDSGRGLTCSHLEVRTR